MKNNDELVHQLSEISSEIAQMRSLLQDKGEVTGNFSIRDRVLSEQQLLRTVIDEIPDYIVLKNHEGKFLLGNKAVANFYGTTPEAMVGKDEGDFGATLEQTEFFRQNVLEIMAKGKTEVVFEESTDDHTGEVRYFKSIKKPFVGMDGKKQILVIAHNVTDLKRAQIQIEQSERRMNYVLEATGEGVWDWDISSGAVQHNARWSELLGYPAGELSNTLDEFANKLYPDDVQGTMDAIQESLKSSGDYRHQHRMIRKDGSVIWVMDRGRVVEWDALGRPSRMVGSIADISLQRQTEQEITQLAFYDALTELPNRRLLIDRLQQAITICHRQRHFGALFLVDIDDFKTINDNLGHGAGDEMLKIVARRLQDAVREMDTVSRVGGDEFVVLVADIGGSLADAMLAAEVVAGKLVRVCNEAFVLRGREYLSSLSVGVVMLDEQTHSTEEVLKRADMAMYASKDAGRNRVSFFEPILEHHLSEKMQLEQELRDALVKDEIHLMYQPIFGKNGELVGAEALVRWRHPIRGRVMPDEFIGLAEKSGLIHDIGQTVLRQACRQLSDWQKSEQTAQLKIAVNVSAQEFHQPNFVARVLEVLQETAAPAGNLKIELTESVMLSNVDDTIAKMSELKRHGIAFALDDFGTGYSSLSYLHHLPLNELKIDRSFVSGIKDGNNSSAIVLSILALAKALDLLVTVEGVESEQQLAFMQNSGCHFFQGYLLGKPVLANDLKIPGTCK